MSQPTTSAQAEDGSGPIRRAIYDKLRGALACPACCAPLDVRPDSAWLPCGGCGARYPIEDGVPILLMNYSGSTRTFAWDRPSSLASIQRLPLVGRLLRRLATPPGSIINVAARENYGRLQQLLSTVPEPQLLYVGGAHGLGYGSEALGAELLQSAVISDISLLPGVDVVADGHRLPFVDERFDGVVVQAVLQYTERPQAVVDEIRRILRTGGYVYSEVPFLQGYCPGHDYHRFTREGLEYLFRDYQRVQLGMANGPASTFSHVAPYFLASLFSFNSGGLYKLWFTAFRWIFAPVRYLDWILKDYDHAPEIASGFYFLGRKEGVRKV